MKELFATLLALLFLGSCSDWPASRQRLILGLPRLPESWRGLQGLQFRLSYREASGRLRELWAPPGASLSVEVERGRSQAFLAQPMFGQARLRPAGALYPGGLAPKGEAEGIFVAVWPWESSGGEASLALDWRDGWLASIHRAVEEAGRDPAAYDLGRLGREAEARLSDPWSQDPRELAAALLAGAFRADRLREPLRIPLLLPPPGPWAPESALAAPPQAGEGGFLVELAPGLHRFYGGQGELSALVFEDGGSALIAGP